MTLSPLTLSSLPVRPALFAGAALLLLVAPARADQAAAAACASGLDGKAKAVFDAAAPGFAAATDPRGLVQAKTRALVEAGTLPMGEARAAAEAAATCLMKLR